MNRPLTKLERFVAEARRRWPGATVTVRKRLDVNGVVDRLMKLPGLRLIRTGPNDPGALDAPWLNWEINRAVSTLPVAPEPEEGKKTTGHLMERHHVIHRIHLRLWQRAADGEVPVTILPAPVKQEEEGPGEPAEPDPAEMPSVATEGPSR